MAAPPDFNTHSVGVGGWVVRNDGAVLLVRMTYGPAEGKLMIPGGHAEPNEPLDETAVREVKEETGVQTIPRGILLIRQRLQIRERNLYFVFHLTPTTQAATPDAVEVCEAVWLTPEEILARDDVQQIAGELANAYRTWPQTCLAERELTWRPDPGYRLWAGQQGLPHEA